MFSCRIWQAPKTRTNVSPIVIGLRPPKALGISWSLVFVQTEESILFAAITLRSLHNAVVNSAEFSI